MIGGAVIAHALENFRQVRLCSHAIWQVMRVDVADPVPMVLGTWVVSVA